MEKINTPLTTAIENINSKIEELEKFTDHENPFPIVRHAKREACMELINFRDQVLKPLLQPERLYMERAHEKGCMDTMSEGYIITLQDSRNIKKCFEDYFTQTFRGYE